MTLQKFSQIFTKIALIQLRTNLFHIVLSAILITMASLKAHAQEDPTVINPTATDTIPDSLRVQLPPVIMDTVKKKNPLDAPVRRKAKGYQKINQRTKKTELYDEAELYYKDIELKSGVIIMDYDKNEVFAGRLKDSLGRYSQLPNFKQGSQVVEADSIHFNTETKKARIWNTYTNQGEFNVQSEMTKKENDSVYFLKNSRFTTSKNRENPEYYFFSNKIKFVPGKKVVVGPTNMWIADVPTPIGLPFAFFPMTNKAESGFIIPTFGDNNTQGYFLQNGGYYFALSDYYDLAVLGDYYTNGSYGLRLESSYAKRYKFNGNVLLRYQNILQSERGFPDFAQTRIYNIQWSHSQDAKANPNSRFSANVNLGSSEFFRQSQNIVDVGSSMVNTMQSSVSYSKTFNVEPQVNVSLTAQHTQNTNTGNISMTLPTLQASMDRIFPFASNDGAKKGLIKNINLQYNLRGENRFETNDSIFFQPEMFRDARSGLQHSIPISTNFKIFRYFSMSASTNYQETWVFNTIERGFNNTTNRSFTRDVRGFDSFRTYNFSTSIGTQIYGTFNFGTDKKIQAIRHVIRPSVSYSYAPSFDRYYDTYQYNAAGTYRTYTRFENGLFGAPGQTYASSIGISVNNTFEAKVRNDENETAEEPKKIMLLNNLNFSTSYNIAADSLQWAPLRVSAGTNLFKQKMNINFGATLDPYAIDNSGNRYDEFNINNGGSLFRMTSANFTVGYSVSSNDGKSGNKSNNNSQTARNGGREDDLFGTGVDLSDSRKSMFTDDEEPGENNDKTEGGFYNAKLPWDLRFAYSLTYNNSRRQNEISGNSLMVSGNVDITPRWKVGFSTGYDFVQKGVTFTQLRFERDLLSWRMDFNWIPFGDNTFWGFFIGIKSSVLSDIKWEKRRVPDRVLR